MLLRNDFERRQRIRRDMLTQSTVPPIGGDDDIRRERLASTQRECSALRRCCDVADGGVVEKWHADGVEARTQDVVEILMLYVDSQ